MILKKQSILFLLFFLGMIVCIFSFFTFKTKNKTTSVQVISNIGVLSEMKIQENIEQYKIRVYYPYTAYEEFNHAIFLFIQKSVKDFKDTVIRTTIPKLQYYTLDIHYDSYSYKNFISYVFYTFLDTGGAHPNTYIHTLTFDKSENSIVTTESLLKRNPNVLEIFSKESFYQLKNSEKFQNEEFQSIQDMVKEGTKATSYNFRNFAFSEDGFIIFFENYQVAPYVYGSFQINIPYSKLNLGI